MLHRLLRPLSVLILLAAGLPCCSSPLSAAEQSPLRVLFLGDGGPHQPHARFQQLYPIFSLRGIELIYTENVQDLNPENLQRYDALLLYANIDRIEPREERALLDYVAGGGGFVPIHSASYCFRNSPEVVALIGAQFQRHGAGEFDTTVVDAEHPITKDLVPFRTWDETYVHHLHNEESRQVLQVRVEGDHREPWTWVRTHGQGRVFYTAYGHDHRTWGNPGFHALVERGVRWAAGRENVFDSRQQLRDGLEPLEYEDVGKQIPNVPAGQPANLMQKPLSPEQSRQRLVLPPGFEARLFASEPQIRKPICMAWDHRGRLWVAETRDYPNELQPEGQGRDRITILEDTTGDGKADKFTLFADKLSIPTSIAFARGGVIVHQAPHTLFLKDTTGDDRADHREVLFTGWSTRDTHAGPSNLNYGLDNWLYGMVGYDGFQGEIAGRQRDFRTGFYRFKPDGSEFEFLRNTNNNSWGVGFSEEGILFGSTANGHPSVYLPIPNRYYERVRGWSSSVLTTIATGTEINPLTDRVRQVDWHGRFTAAAGHALYTARNYPRPYWNRAAFVSEPTGHLTATFLLERQGADFRALPADNLLAGDDAWTSPIVAEVGPDGNVWVIDWYTYIVQHNPTPAGFQTGRGNAYETDLRETRFGRIYRIVYTGADGSEGNYPPAALDADDPDQLIRALSDDNLFWRRHAQRLLVERGKTDIASRLYELVADRASDELGLNAGAIHALWTLHGLGLRDEPTRQAVVAALRHPAAGVRRNAAAVLAAWPDAAESLLSAGLPADDDAQVRLAALLALADMRPTAAGAEALVASLADPARDNAGDRWLREAATAAAAVHEVQFLQAACTHQPALRHAGGREVLARVAEHFARGDGQQSEQLPGLLATLVEAEPDTATAIVGGLFQGWPQDRRAALTEADQRHLLELLRKLPPQGKTQLTALAGRWGTDALAEFSATMVAEMMEEVADEQLAVEARMRSARQLIEFLPQDAAVAERLMKMISARTDSELAVGLLEAARGSEAAETGDAIAAQLPEMTPAVRSAALRALLVRREWTEALLSAAEAGHLQLSELPLDQRQNLARHPNPQLAARAQALIESGGGLPNPDRQRVIDEISERVLRPGDPLAGAKIYKEHCGSCHRYQGEGGKVGPDLTGFGTHPKAELLVHILDPSRDVEGNYRQYTLVTVDGRVINGLLSSETRTAVEMLDAEGNSHQVLREDIDELIASDKSLMPEGFEESIGIEGLADLLEFLTQRGQFVPLDLSRVATAVSTRGMFHSQEAQQERLIFSDWSEKTFADVPFQLVDPQGDSRPNVVLLHGPNGRIPPQMPKSVQLPVNGPAVAIHLLSGVSGWGHPLGTHGSVSMIVRLHYADGETEDHPLRNGIHFADYIRRVDVPESQFAFALRGQQIRYLAVYPERREPIESLELVKGPDATAPVVMAVTVETPGE